MHVPSGAVTVVGTADGIAQGAGPVPNALCDASNDDRYRGSIQGPLHLRHTEPLRKSKTSGRTLGRGAKTLGLEMRVQGCAAGVDGLAMGMDR
jgi:hypothetical protein